MNRHLILLSSLLFLQIPSFPIQAASSIAQNLICKIEREDEFYSNKELQTLASKITVKVIGDNNSGSGTIIGKQGNNYLVITNAHVLQGVNSIKLKTSDNKTYSAKIIPQTNFDKSDITLLEFQSNQNYCLPEISQATPEIDTPLLAAGFSASTDKIAFSPGEVKKTSNLKEGYEIGYTSNIEQGMSGGAILNSLGELVGINGKSAYPILNTGYIYQDGKRPSEAEINEMRKLSWGIPISTFLARVDGNILSTYKLPLPKNTGNKISQFKFTGWLGELEQKAKQFTVRIDSSSNANGSGIIIAKEGNTYTVLTAAHVLCERADATKPCGEFNYEILAPDGNKYSVDKSSIKIEKGVDLAVVKFKSSGNYQIATLADYNPNMEDFIFTAGYPKLANNSPWRLTVGQIASKELGLLVVKDSDFSLSGIKSLGSTGIGSLTGGYELVYTSITYGGMSGGPVLDSQGRVIGIHGRAEGEEAYDSKTGDCGGSGSSCQIQIGFSLGVPVSTFLGLASRLGVKPQQLANTRPPQINSQQVESIKKAALTADVSGENATADKWLERGNQLLRLERFEEADRAFNEVIKRKSSFAHLAYAGKGFNFSSQDKDKEAVAAFEQAVKLKPDFVLALRMLSFMYVNLEQYDKALKAVNKTIQLQPNNPNSYVTKGLIFLNSKQITEAEVPINKAIKLSPHAFAYSLRGVIYAAQEKWDLAIADLDKAMQIAPKSNYTYALRGMVRFKQEKWDLAIADFNEAIKINSQNYYLNTHMYRGFVYLRQQKWDLAFADLNKAIQLKPQSDEPYFARGVYYFVRQELDLALADFNKAIQLNPKSDSYYIFRGRFYVTKQKWDSALADFNKAVELNPKSSQAYAYRGISYLRKKQFNLASADVNKAIELDPKSAEGYSGRAILYLAQQKLDLALADFNKAVELNPKSNEVYELRGRLYVSQRKWDLALADFNKAIEINPNSAQSYAFRGISYLRKGELNLASADVNKAIQINPNLADAYNGRGLFYIAKQKWDLAKADLDKAITLEPNSGDGYFFRGIYYIRQQKWDLAEADFNKAINHSPRLSEAYSYRGVAYIRQKKWDLALADFNQAIKLNPNSADAYFGRGVYYTNQKQWDFAIADYSKAIEINPNYIQAYTHRGNIYTTQQKWDLALGDFNKVIQINPNNAKAYTNRGAILIKKGNKQEGIQDLQKAAQLFKAQNNNADYQKVISSLQKLQQ